MAKMDVQDFCVQDLELKRFRLPVSFPKASILLDTVAHTVLKCWSHTKGFPITPVPTVPILVMY